jgi:hypothetical protein
MTSKQVFVAVEYWEKAQNSTGYLWSEAIHAMRSAGLDVHLVHPKPKGDGDAPYVRYGNPIYRAVVSLILGTAKLSNA